MSQANQLVDLSADICLSVTAVGGIFVVENPESSSMWLYPKLAQMLLITRATFVVTHYCQWLSEEEFECDLPWLKPTVLAGTLPGLRSVGRQCSARGLCERWHRPHRALVGKRKNGEFWTRFAEPYPKALCNALADLFVAALATANRPAAASASL